MKGICQLSFLQVCIFTQLCDSLGWLTGIASHVSWTIIIAGMNSKGMDFGRFVSLPVVVVLLIMGFVYHTVVVWVIQPWLSLSTASGLANAMLLTALCIMALVSYALAVIQDPGRVPSSYLPDLEDSAITLHEVKRKVFPSPCLL